MEFKKGDKVSWIEDGNHLTGIIDSVLGGVFCAVSITEDGLPIGVGAALHSSMLNKDTVVPEEPTPLKMTLALEETLKEIIHHLNDGNYKLTEQYIAHDYSSINKSHDIKITMVLKENE